MPSLWLRPYIFALAALLLPASLLNAALPKHKLDPADSSLAGQLLIASPKMPDPRFRGTVILMVRHNKDGAFGITINRPIGEQPLANFLDGPDEKQAAAEGTLPIYAGGPVQPEIGFVVHTDDYRRKDTTIIGDGLAVTSSQEILRDIARKKGPEKTLVAFGYAGWSSGQLESEIDRDDWVLAPADPHLVFDELRDKVWEQAMARR